MPFGGEIKLLGESEYRKAIETITQDLGKMSNALKTQANDFSASDKSLKSSEQKQKELNETLKEQQTQLAKAKSAYAQYSVAVQTQTQRHNALSKEYKDAVKELDRIEKECGKTSDEYKKQAEVVDQLGQELADSTEELNDSKTAMSDLKKEINSSQKVINQTSAELDSLGNEAEKSGKDAEKAKFNWEDFGEGLASVGKAIGVALTAVTGMALGAGKALWDMAGDVSSVGDEIDKESQKLGISAENYQALSYAMDRNGASIDDFKKGLMNIKGDLADVQNGVEGAGSEFEALGVSLKNADGSVRSTEEVLLDSIDALANMSDETQRNAYAQKIFGKSYQELAPLLNNGSEGIHDLMEEAKEYGMVMSDDTVKASAEFQDSLTKMQGTMDGVKNNMIGQFLPSMTLLVDGFTDLIAGNEGASEAIKEGVGGVVETISAMIPQAVELISTIAEAVMESAPTIITSLADGIMQAIPQLAPVVVSLITELTTSMIEMLPQILDMGIDIILELIHGITDAIPQLVALMPTVINSIVQTLLDNIGEVIDTGIELLLALIEGLSDAIPQLVEYIPQIITTIVKVLIENLPKIIEAGVKILVSLISGIAKTIPQLVQAVPEIISSIVQTLSANLPQILQSGVDIIMELISGIGQTLGELATSASEIGQTVMDALSDLPSKVLSIGSDIVRGLWNGISDMTSWVIGKIKGFGGDILGGLKSFFGIASPSKLFEDEVGVYLAEGIGVGFEKEMKDVTKQMQDALPTSFDVNSTVTGSGSNYSYISMVDAFKEALSEMKIELDDDEVGRFVDKTVTRLIYT